MKVVKAYENFRDFDPDFAIAKIKHFYSEYEVKNMVDDELQNWISLEEIPEKYNDIYEWFYDSHPGDITNKQKMFDKQRDIAIAVSEITVDRLVDWYEREFKTELTDEQRDVLSKRIIKTYEGIDPINW